MNILAPGVGNFPLKEPAFCSRAAVLVGTIALTPGHRGFVCRYHVVRIAVLPDTAGVNPHDAMAEAANLIELMGDEDDGTAGASDVAHFAQALFLEIDVP